MKTIYREIPSMKSVFKVTENCCYEQVVYEGKIIGITSKNDNDLDKLNSWNLICDICDPNLFILQISKEDYENKKQLVESKLKPSSP